MVVESAPAVVYASVAVRFISALLPIGILTVTKFIIDSISASGRVLRDGCA